MIRAKSIVIDDFRGIRHLELDFGGKNFGICGRNGTGKSGVVDAIEFALTGTISRLAGPGTGGLSVKEHGPHVDTAKKPDRASVSLIVNVPSLNRDVTIVRTVKDAKNAHVTPDTPEVRALLARVSQHPEFTLSRRELIKYVLAEPTKRGTQVQELLRLDEITTGRLLLQKILNSCERSAQTAKLARENAAAALKLALGQPKLSTAGILSAANEQRAILGLSAINTFDATTSIKVGIISPSNTAKPSRVIKVQAKQDVELLRRHLDGTAKPETIAIREAASAAVDVLAKDQKVLESASREALLKSALEAFDEDTCPVCDTPWKQDDFRRHVQKKLAEFDAVSLLRKGVETKIQPVLNSLQETREALKVVARYGVLLQPAIDGGVLTAYAETLTASCTRLQKLLPIAETIETLADTCIIPEDVKSALTSFEVAINLLPDPNQEDAARDFLSVGQEKLEAYRQTSNVSTAADRRAVIARRVSEAYNQSTTNALLAIFQRVEETFSRLYRLINHDDEANFEGKLTPLSGSLDFKVDFYGRGLYPPGAYHSEGHQDGMGLCLYLALMKDLAGDSFTFAVLDDVLMSVDAGHRREVSKMLIDQFPNTQFLLTTHDKIWLSHMRSVGLIGSKNFAHFRTWSVDLGPADWSNRTVWEEIDEDLKKDDVRAAAALLRNFLEHFSTEACDLLRAPVAFSGSAQYNLGELLPGATNRLSKLLKSAKTTAHGWGQSEQVDAIAALDEHFTSLVKSSQVEQWQVNAAVHFNSWADLNKSDFAPVVESYKQLVNTFECGSCGGILSVSPSMGPPEALRCGCGMFNMNLKKKP